MTRLFPESAMNNSPPGPTATPDGPCNDDALTTPEADEVKFGCPSTTSGVIRPVCLTGIG